MKRFYPGVFIVFITFLLSGCFYAGRWEDDPKNWDRAFGGSKPKEVSIIHSLYWRTLHFTREDGWTFQIRGPEEFKKVWIDHYKLRSPSKYEMSKISSLREGRPSWFIPKPISDYQVWILADEPDSSFGLFVDRATGDIFITDSG